MRTDTVAQKVVVGTDRGLTVVTALVQRSGEWKATATIILEPPQVDRLVRALQGKPPAPPTIYDDVAGGEPLVYVAARRGIDIPDARAALERERRGGVQ